MTPACTGAFRNALIGCGFKRGLILSDYQYADFRAQGMPLRTADLVAFTNRPMDLSTAAVAVVRAQSGEGPPSGLLERCWALGAPHVFIVPGDTAQWWIIKGRDEPEHKQNIPLQQVGAFFADRAADFSPRQIRARKWSFGRQLEFVDAGLLPALNHEVGRKLHDLLEQLIVDAVAAYQESHAKEPEFRGLFRLVFRLVTGKILKDKGELPDLEFSSPRAVMQQVAAYYGEPEFDHPALDDREVAKLLADGVSRGIRFHNLSADSLAYIYENTLVTRETRKLYGTHSTPREIADYITWRLPIDEVPFGERHVFDPGVGCATLLVSAMRRLKLDIDPSWGMQREHRYFVSRLAGFDVDQFALEAAVLALTLADFPNRDGWRMRMDNLWTSSALESGARKATILLANPPFEDFTPKDRAGLRRRGMEPAASNKASELLRRALPCLPTGALIGMVLPRETLEGKRSLSIREEVLKALDLIEVCLLPDRMFTHSKTESGLLLARKTKRRTNVSFRQVGEDDRERFRERYGATFEDSVAQSYFASQPECVLRVPLLRGIWECTEGTCIKVGDVARVGKGLNYHAQKDLPRGTHTVSDTCFDGAVRGYNRVRDSLRVLSLVSPVWMSVDEEAVQVGRMGTETGCPQVLLNYARSRRRVWRASAAVDSEGSAVSSRFYCVRPTSESVSLRFLAAVINGPVANAFLCSYCDRRDNSYPVVRGIPVPQSTVDQRAEVEQAVQAYEEAIRPREPFQPEVSKEALRELLARVDTLVLSLYRLPGELREALLGRFSGVKRPGVPFRYELGEELLTGDGRGQARLAGEPSFPFLSGITETAKEYVLQEGLDGVLRSLLERVAADADCREACVSLAEYDDHSGVTLLGVELDCGLRGRKALDREDDLYDSLTQSVGSEIANRFLVEVR